MSRKGFDMGCGNSPSIYLPSKKILYSFPIPADETARYNLGHDDDYTYKDFKFNNELSCYELLEQLNIKCRNNYAHCDPDIRPDLFNKEQPDWKPRFGQQGNPLRHLNRQGVGIGDLFLFYGLYQEVKEECGQYVFVPNTKCQIIWGYLQVSNAVIPNGENRKGIRHPHYLNYYDYTDGNKVFECETDELLDSKFLSSDKKILKYGVFDYDESLVLSENAGSIAEEYNRLKLPVHFYEHKMSGNGEQRFKLSDGKRFCMVQMCNRGQEFVIQDNDDAEKWAINLIEKNYKKQGE